MTESKNKKVKMSIKQNHLLKDLLYQNKEMAIKLGFLKDSDTDEFDFAEHPVEEYKNSSIKCKEPIFFFDGENMNCMEYAFHYINKYTYAISMFIDFQPWRMVRFNREDFGTMIDLMITPYLQLAKITDNQ